MSHFHEKVIYQIYPKSFNDSTGNGIGDLNGITQKLPYLAELGIDMIWLNPFYVSPQRDNGYDITDYVNIDPLFGTMADFERLVQVAKENHIEIMLDMVLNHTSITHEWFQKALAGDKEYQDYYIIKDGKPNGELPTNWQSKFGGPAWAPFGNTGKYYLHLFDVTQADLNWKNPAVRAKLFDVVNFWQEKGVTGFRFDVINLIDKPAIYKDDLEGDGKYLYTDNPKVHEYLREMNRASFGKNSENITVGEMSATTIPNSILYSNPEREELSMVFSFHHLKVDYQNGEKWTKMPFDFMGLKELLHEWQQGMTEGKGWNALFWNNHDQPRALTRFGDDGVYRTKSAQMLAATIHLLRGTPYIYQGEEIGMTNPKFNQIEEYVDVETQNAYRILSEEGMAHETIMEIIKDKSRDNSRTPMQWSNDKNAGFTEGTPWLRVAENYPEINVAQELKDGEIFKFYQKLIQLRKEKKIISEGNYRGLFLLHPSVFGYVREYQGEKLLVMNNFYGKETVVDIPDEFLQINGEILLGNGSVRPLESEFILEPYETIAFYFKGE